MDYMKRALELAIKATGISSPNPPVGAVVVRSGEIVGEGHTMPAGQAHAEIMALRQAGDMAKGATLYTTLEPCCHYGKTPPCTKAIIDAGITKVHISMVDPNPLVNGNGITELQHSGIISYLGAQSDKASEVMEAYIKFITTGFPFVVAKFAISLDGKIATSSGDSKWITSERARCYARKIRQQNDAIVVGIGTILSDDPRLTARDIEGKAMEKQPLRIVVDSSARLPLNAQLFRENGHILVATANAPKLRTDALRAIGADVLTTTSQDGLVNLHTLLKTLGDMEITSLMVEGGGTLLGSFFDLGLVDKVIAFISPVIIGGTVSQTPVSGFGANTMADAIRLKHPRIDTIGEDVVMTGYIE